MQIPGYYLVQRIQQDERSAFWRARDVNNRSVIVKTPLTGVPSVREIARYQWAFDRTREADQRAVAQHLDLVRFGASVALVFDDDGSTYLSDMIVPGGLPLITWLELSVMLSTSIGRFHLSGLVHKDIKPSNVLVAPNNSGVRLTNLDLAISLRRETVGAVTLKNIEGTLAYMSPEQSGRISGQIDNRSDLYSLGVTLFELACGQLPFQADTAVELAHAHVARPAPLLQHLRADLPPILSDIVNRLLAKNADERYSSAQGLTHDLTHCLDELQRTGTVRTFELGIGDTTSTFRVPDRLYGREVDHEQLLSAFEQARQGIQALVTVSGLSGIGKTALVNDTRRGLSVLHSHQGNGRYDQFYLGSGKFDQFRTDLPYVGIMQALGSLLRQVLAEPEETLSIKREQLQRAMGSHGRLLTDMLPDLLAIIGHQPEVEAVPPRDAERRLHRLVGQFLAIFATPERPLLLFLDDLQWADPSSLQLLESLVSDTSLNYSVLICGYRSNEVSIGHPLHVTLQVMRATARMTADITLGPLKPADIDHLLADTLHTEPDKVHSLGSYIHTASGGNPFVAREFLRALHSRGFFQYDEEHHAWSWNIARLKDYSLPDSVAALLTDRLRELSPRTLDLLDTAACVGSEFDLRTLADVHEMTQSAAAVGLSAAVRDGVIVPLDAHYKDFESLDAWDVTQETLGELGTARYRFQHDQVRQTVHERLDATRQAQRHLHIGRLLLKSLSPEELNRQAVDVFAHVVFALDMVQDPDERKRLSHLGLAAGLRAQRAMAFTTARTLLRAAAQLLSPTAWDEDYDTALGIHLALAECAYALTLSDEFESSSQLVIQHARTSAQRSLAYGLKIRANSGRNQYAEAVDVGVEVAASLGVKLPRKPHIGHILWAAVRVLVTQRGRDPRVFDELPVATDPEIQIAISLLGSAAGAAYFAEPNLLPLIGITCTRLSIKHGITPQSSYGFAVWALVLCGALGRIENGYRFGDLAMSIGRRYGGADESRANFVVHAFVKHWKEPYPEVVRLLHADWAYNRDSGDEENATYSAGAMVYTHFLAGGSLDARERFEEVLLYLRNSEQHHTKHAFLAWTQLIAAMREKQVPDDLEGEWFRYTDRIPEFERTNNVVQMGMGVLAAAVLDFLAGRLDRAEERFALVSRQKDALLSQSLEPGMAFFRALNAYHRVAAGLAETKVLRMARRQCRRLERWAVHAPFNLNHRISLLKAEELAQKGKAAEAILMLHRAFEQASGAPFYQALAQQSLARLLRENGSPHLANDAVSRAAELFREWGSPWISEATRAQVATHTATLGLGSTTIGSAQLEGTDLQSLLAAVTSISSEIDETSLLDHLMPNLIEVAGADRGVLLLIDASDKILVEAEANMERTISRRVRLDDFDIISRRVVDLALRSRELVLIHDAGAAEMLRGESYAEDNGIAAILAVPIALQGRMIAMLYLENHVARGAFTAGRVEIARALGAQTAIALQNARLYGRVQTALNEQTIMTEANRRFVPGGFLKGLGCTSIVDVKLNEVVEREMNVMFVDLRSFSTISSQLGPRGTIELINRYLSHVQPGIAVHGGFVAQYYGDGILALFPDNTDDALRGAIAMCRGLDGYNRTRAKDSPALRFGIGMHSGTVILGTIGDQDHFQCSVVGESVNMASRMESLCKHFGATLILSETAHKRVRAPEQFGFRSLGLAQVAGWAQPIEVFECIAAYPMKLQEQILKSRDIYTEGLAAYRNEQWEQAFEHFNACLQVCAQDMVAHGFAQRCHDNL